MNRRGFFGAILAAIVAARALFAGREPYFRSICDQLIAERNRRQLEMVAVPIHATIMPVIAGGQITEMLVCTLCEHVFPRNQIGNMDFCPKCSPRRAVRDRIMGTPQ